jgi:hypothetical protein
MKALIRFTFLAALCCTATAVLAEGADELWEVTMKMEMPGMPAMPPQTSQVCKIKGDRDPSKTADKGSDCKVVDSKQSGNRSTWKAVCTKPDAMTMLGDVTYGGDRYQGTIKVTGSDMDMTQNISGKKIGNCTYEDPAKKVAQMQAQSQAQSQAMIDKECDKQIDDLQPAMILGAAGIPPESMICKHRKANFCSRAAKVAQQMRDPAAFADGNRKYPNWRDAMQGCGTDPATVSGPICKVAVDKKDWYFVSENCPVEGRVIAQQNCTGMDYTAVMSSPYKQICQKYGADLAKKKVAGEKAQTETPAPKSDKDKAVDAVKDGASKLKSLLKF